MPDSQKACVARALAELERSGTPERARGTAAYFKAYEKVQVFGVDSPTVRRMAARIRNGEGARWTIREAVAFADAMLARPHLEAKGLGACLLGRFRRQFTPALLPTTKRWLARHCHDWASTDTLCGEVIGPLIADRPELMPLLRRWRTSKHLYVRRASAVALLPAIRAGAGHDDAYDVALLLGAQEHHLLQKAAGWVLREVGKADMPRLERFLRQQGSALGRTTVRYAVERFAPAERLELLVATKGGLSPLSRRQRGTGPLTKAGKARISE